MTPDDLAAKHKPYTEWYGTDPVEDCEECGARWPCDVDVLVAALRDAWAERGRLRTVEQDALVVLSVAFPTNTMPWLMDVGVAACVSLLASERDDARAALARVEALCDKANAEWGGMVPTGNVRAAMKGES